MKEEFEFEIEKITSLDIPSMAKLTEEEFIEYVKADNLLYVDHHDVLRCGKTGRPFATTPRQMDLFIEYLSFLRNRLN